MFVSASTLNIMYHSHGCSGLFIKNTNDCYKIRVSQHKNKILVTRKQFHSIKAYFMKNANCEREPVMFLQENKTTPSDE
jgi:hypothetical protein